MNMKMVDLSEMTDMPSSTRPTMQQVDPVRHRVGLDLGPSNDNMADVHKVHGFHISPRRAWGFKQ